jgi:hypothetical protein
MNVPTFNEIWDEILSKKIIQKNKQYGNSLEEPALTFNKIDDLQLLINIRLDDKLKRMEMLDDTDEKYWSEIKEIIAYLMWKLYVKKEADLFENNNRQQGDEEQSAENIRKDDDPEDYLRFLGIRRLSDIKRRSIRT